MHISSQQHNNRPMFSRASHLSVCIVHLWWTSFFIDFNGRIRWSSKCFYLHTCCDTFNTWVWRAFPAAQFATPLRIRHKHTLIHSLCVIQNINKLNKCHNVINVFTENSKSLTNAIKACVVMRHNFRAIGMRSSSHQTIKYSLSALSNSLTTHPIC